MNAQPSAAGVFRGEVYPNDVIDSLSNSDSESTKKSNGLEVYLNRAIHSTPITR